jgi:hypothetical protein
MCPIKYNQKVVLTSLRGAGRFETEGYGIQHATNVG